jgi:two-component system response regulator
LPKIDGIGVLKLMKADPVAKLIPVVVLTSSNEECDIVETYRLGVNSYIVKPVDFEKFVDSIKHIGSYWLLMNQLPDLKILIR